MKSITRFTKGNSVQHFVCMLALLAAAASARAQSVVTSLTGTSAITNNNTSATWGYSFTLGGVDGSLTALGVWDQGGDGLAQAHSVALWSSSGTLIASGTVPSGTVANLVSGFRYVSVTAVPLSANTTYVLGIYDSSSNTDQITFKQTATLGSDIASLGAPVYNAGSSLTFPTTAVTSNAQGFFGPNAIVVPEPSAYALSGLGALAVVFAIRRRRAARP